MMTSSINSWKPVRNKLIQLKEQFLFLHVLVLFREERERERDSRERKNKKIILSEIYYRSPVFFQLPDIKMQIEEC